ncbi:hypothetical protein HUJ04_010197 [Dendroctonus ponderosae]|nr:hypothetical protein HUJ04_010197 [Dendroctonus ponderosae]
MVKIHKFGCELLPPSIFSNILHLLQFIPMRLFPVSKLEEMAGRNTRSFSGDMSAIVFANSKFTLRAKSTADSHRFTNSPSKIGPVVLSDSFMLFHPIATVESPVLNFVDIECFVENEVFQYTHFTGRGS